MKYEVIGYHPVLLLHRLKRATDGMVFLVDLFIAARPGVREFMTKPSDLIGRTVEIDELRQGRCVAGDIALISKQPGKESGG